MTLISLPSSYQQMAAIPIDAGIARDTALMLADAHAILDGPAAGNAPAAARQAAAILADAGSPYTLQALAGAVSQTVSMLYRAIDGALVGVPDQTPVSSGTRQSRELRRWPAVS